MKKTTCLFELAEADAHFHCVVSEVGFAPNVKLQGIFVFESRGGRRANKLPLEDRPSAEESPLRGVD